MRTADQLEKEDALRRQVRAAMVYPAVVVSFAIAVLLALVAFIVPVFAKVFKDFGGQLPTLTKFTVGLSHLITGQWYRSEEHTSELQSPMYLVCRLLLEKKKTKIKTKS